MINSEYLNAYYTIDFQQSQDENNDRNYLRESETEIIDKSEQSDNHEIDDENITKQNVVIALKFENSDDEIITHFAVIKVMKSHIYKDCQQAFNFSNLLHKHICQYDSQLEKVSEA